MPANAASATTRSADEQRLLNSGRLLFQAPRELLRFDRFDVYLKWAYAAAFVVTGNATDFATAGYVEHLASLNGFREGCEGKVRRVEKATVGYCSAKNSSSAFLDSFRKLLVSMQTNGFVLAGDSRRAIPLCCPGRSKHCGGGILSGGSHRLAAALALGHREVPTMPCMKWCDTATPQLACKRPDYSAEMFKAQGMHSVFADWAVHHAITEDSAHHVVHIWPKGVLLSRDQPFDLARVKKLVAQECSSEGGVVYHKMIPLSDRALLGYLRHAYGDVSWVQAKHDAVRQSAGREDNLLYVLVVRSSPERVAKCKPLIREFYAKELKRHNRTGVDPKATVHITDFHGEAIVAAQMLFNENSLAYLHHVPGTSTCRDIAQGVSLDLALVRAKPRLVESQHRRHQWKRGAQVFNAGATPLHLIPEGLLVDTGTALALMELRKPTDVDLIAAPGELQTANRLIQRCPDGPTPRPKCNRGYGSHQPGTPHAFWFSFHNVSDAANLVHDPTRHAFCWGLKFTAPSQMAEYKERRLGWRRATRAIFEARHWKIKPSFSDKEMAKDRNDSALLSSIRSSCRAGELNGFCCSTGASPECPVLDHRGAHLRRVARYTDGARDSTCRVLKCFRSASCKLYGCIEWKHAVYGRLTSDERHQLLEGTFNFSETHERQPRRLRKSLFSLRTIAEIDEQEIPGWG